MANICTGCDTLLSREECPLHKVAGRLVSIVERLYPIVREEWPGSPMAQEMAQVLKEIDENG